MKINKKVLSIAKAKLKLYPEYQEYYGCLTSVEILQLLMDGWKLRSSDKKSRECDIEYYKKHVQEGEMFCHSVYFEIPKNSGIVKVKHDKESLK